MINEAAYPSDSNYNKIHSTREKGMEITKMKQVLGV
jgi:hypothetical protein